MSRFFNAFLAMIVVVGFFAGIIYWIDFVMRLHLDTAPTLLILFGVPIGLAVFLIIFFDEDLNKKEERTK